MVDPGIVDTFLSAFSRYIDNGFGLVKGDVAFLCSALIAIDMTLAGLFWAWGDGEDMLQRLIKKTLFVGVFAYLIGNFNWLAGIVFNSFAGLGLKASGSGMTLTTFLQPSWIAHTGMDAARPVISAIGDIALSGGLLLAAAQALILLTAYLLIILAFFLLSVQLFVTLVEFKLTTLAGFVLLPFGLFGKTAFLAEKVLGNIVSSGVKVLVLAVIVGIGGGLFAQMTSGFGATPPTAEDALSIALGALTLLGLGIFGPGVANGLISGGPQLAMGSAVGTTLVGGGGLLAGGAASVGAARLGTSAVGGAVRGGAAVVGGAQTAYGRGAESKSGPQAVWGGLRGVAQAGAAAAVSPLRRAASAASQKVSQSYEAGREAVLGPAAGSAQMPRPTESAATPMSPSHNFQAGAQAGLHGLHRSDGGGNGASVDLPKEE